MAMVSGHANIHSQPLPSPARDYQVKRPNSPKRLHNMHMPENTSTLKTCLRYLSKDRERDWRWGRALQAARDPRRGRVWTRPKRTCRL